jgi:hypothetical protein
MKVVPILSYDEAQDGGAAVHDHWLRMNGAARGRGRPDALVTPSREWKFPARRPI